MNITTKVIRKILAVKYNGDNLEEVVEFLNRSHLESGYCPVTMDNIRNHGDYCELVFGNSVTDNFNIGDYFIITKPHKNNLKKYTKYEFDEKFVEL